MATVDELIQKELNRKIKPGNHTFGDDYAATKAAVGSSAIKQSAVAAADAAVTAVADANVQTGSYVQGDVESIRALANDLKTQFNAAVTLINELKAKMDAMNA